ncbi:Sulfoquinovosyl transferase sqd2 [Dinochytrium kinnereticum]|nr:Sulfoquinovosyl transferase sqd2 [Dinochytrium kinnereticum]
MPSAHSPHLRRQASKLALSKDAPSKQRTSSKALAALSQPTHGPADDEYALSSGSSRPLRILMATEYLPPFVSGIANRCKNLAQGYRDNGHHVTLFGCHGTNADVVVPSVPNIFYPAQRMFIFPPLMLIFQLLNFFQEVPYDIIHVVSPLCLAFVFLLPLFKLRGVKIYVSYHVYLEYYSRFYFGDNKILIMFLEGIYSFLYFIPLVWFADVVGIPSKTADWPVFKFSKKIHYMKSGLNTNVFIPTPENYDPIDDNLDAPPLPIPSSLLPMPGAPSTSTPLTHAESLLSHPSPAGGWRHGPALLYVGRLAPEKNVEFLISALHHPSLLTSTLIIVGDGPQKPSLEALAWEVVGRENVHVHVKPEDGVEEKKVLGRYAKGMVDGRRFRVIFAGMIHDEKDIATYYANVDAFVSASGSETFGFTVAEAMACGTPAVVVRAGAFATVYRMVDGWMYEDGNIDDYAGRVGRVLGDGRLARRAGRRVAVNGFSVASAVRDLLKMYEWVVDSDGKAQKRIAA